MPEIYYAKAAPTLDPVARIDHAEKFLHATGAKIAHGGNRAYYSLSTDAVQMPPFESFRDADSYYSTLAHELTHWTGSKNRLDRDFGGHRFGSNAYAQEELVAELGAAFLCADLELALEAREDHSAYIANWLEVLKGDSRAIFTAAAHAQRAADFIHKFSVTAQTVGLTPAALEAMTSEARPGFESRTWSSSPISADRRSSAACIHVHAGSAPTSSIFTSEDLRRRAETLPHAVCTCEQKIFRP